MTLFIPAERFGGLGLTEAQKQDVLVQALRSNQLASLRQDVPFEAYGQARLLQAELLYQLDGRTRPPKLKAGYEFTFELEQSAAIELIHLQTQIRASIFLQVEGL
jgi:hypothetical protein